MLMQENIGRLNKKTGKKGAVVLKIDLAKAYDRTHWDFLEYVLNDFNFPPEVVKLIMFCVSSTSMAILWNG